MPDVYWAMVAEATAYADLARVDMATGVSGCAVINQVKAVEEAAMQTMADALGVKLDEAKKAGE